MIPKDSSLISRNIFARNLRKYRRLKGLSQEKLAELAKLHRTYVGSVERGERNISLDNMERLAIALEIKLVDLLAENEPASWSGTVP